MLYKTFSCTLFILLATGYGQVGSVLFSAARAVPKLLNYQGYLTDTLGSPIEDSLDMTFKIYDAATLGNVLWSETQLDVPVERGVFSVLLGNVNSIPDTAFTQGTDRWLELTLEGPQTLSPRMRITAVGYAYTAAYCDTAEYARSAATDNDWVRGTPDSVLFTANYLGVARGGANNMLYGDNVHTHTNFGGSECTSGFSGQNYTYATICGGRYNNAFTDFATVVGGDSNSGTWYSFVGGGQSNSAGGSHTTVAGGRNNTTSALYGGILSGYSNIAGDEAGDTAVVVVGGWENSATGTYSFIGGGRYNTASYSATVAGGGWNAASYNYATVAGGYFDTASAYCATVAGGWSNTASGEHATVGGGSNNTASNASATVAGGRNNTASARGATVAGGYAGTINALYGGILAGYNNIAGGSGDSAATVVGGRDNIATGMYPFVGGGKNNRADSNYTFVGGGSDNIAGEVYCFVGGGGSNTAWGDYATVAGGRSNTANGLYATVAGGQGDTASGDYATVGGGNQNTASGDYATVGGGLNNTGSGDYATMSGGLINIASGSWSTAAGGYADTCAGMDGFTGNSWSKVPSAHNNSAAFNGQVAFASGQMRVGALSKASGTFTIDHPLDPMNKILNHYFVESPEMVLIYRGVARIGTEGRAEVHLPDYFDALNRNPMIQLTGVGTSDVFVAEKVKGNRFVIGGKPGTEVYWTVTGDRKDQSAEITRIIMPVEQIKEDDLAGRSLNDDFLASTISQLEQMGKAGKFQFRTQRGRERYEDSRRRLMENR